MTRWLAPQDTQRFAGTMAADASTALMDFRFALPMLARSTDLDKETVETACALAEMEAECIVEAATALAAKGVPYDYTEDEGFATQCAELVKRAVASAAAEVRPSCGSFLTTLPP